MLKDRRSSWKGSFAILYHDCRANSQRRRSRDTRRLFSPSRTSSFVQKLRNFQRCPIRAIPLRLYVKVFHRYSLFGQYATPTVRKNSTPYRNIYYAASVYEILYWQNTLVYVRCTRLMIIYGRRQVLILAEPIYLNKLARRRNVTSKYCDK